ncbi:uncharacterized protein TNCV_4145771 [Trichonephila clavipes]|nr:uncharacterized protein TNCV_4145771 [Trichonephila clavipes]
MIRWALKLSEFNIEWEHRPGVQNVVADVLSRNPVGNMDGSQISCAALRALALNSREQLIREQREDPELGYIYRYLENRRRFRNRVNIDQARVYRPRQSDTVSSDSHFETLFEGQRLSDRSSRSQPGKFKGSRKTLSEQNNGHKSSKGNAGLEDPRLKRKVESTGSGDRKNLIRAIPFSVSSRNQKYRRPNNPSQGSQPIAGPSHQQDSRQDKSPTVASRHEGSGQYKKARETKTTKNRTNRAADRRTVWSNQMTAVRPCPYYLRSRVRQPEGFPEERRNSGIASIPQNNIRSLTMEALDGDPVDRSE